MEKKRRKGFPAYPGSFFTHSIISIFIILEAGFIIAQAFYLARAITGLFDGFAFTVLLADIGLFFAAFICRYLLQHSEMLIAEKFARNTAKLLRSQLLQDYFSNQLTFVQQKGTGHLVTLVMEGVDKVKAYVQIIGIRMIKTFVIPTAIVIFVFLYDTVSAVILVLTVPIVIIFMILLGMAAEKMADKQYATYTRLSNHFLDSLKGLETLTYLGQSRNHAKKIHQVSNDLRKATMKTLRVAFLSSFALDFFTSLSIAFVAVGLGLRLIDGSITLLPALMILILAPEYFSPIKQVGKDYHATLDGQIAMADIASMQENNKADEHKELQLGTWQADSQLAFEQVEVAVGEKKLLQHISFSVNQGMVGIVGRSGAGKSTLINVLAGRLQPLSGSMMYDGQRLDSLQHKAWMEQISYIPQFPYIFPLSLADNIRFYAPEASDEAVLEMVKAIGLKELAESFPGGIHEKIGEGARSLSGGQAQRVALARALLSGKPILLLDEPTAHLDIETEYEIKQLILTLCKEKLVFLATHRLHWMKEMDEILLFGDGELLTRGTDQSLRQSSEAYRDFIEWRRERRT